MLLVITLSALLLAGQTATPSAPKPIDPQSWMTGTPYPADAKANKQQGNVGFTVNVDRAGHVTGCRVTTSSGAKSLDDATCAAISAHARFEPARDAAGKDVAGTFSSSSTWRLPLTDAKPIDLTKGAVRLQLIAIRVALAADGKVTSCTVLKKERANGEPCKAFPAGRQLTAPLTKNGKPVSATYTLSDAIEIAPN